MEGIQPGATMPAIRVFGIFYKSNAQINLQGILLVFANKHIVILANSRTLKGRHLLQNFINDPAFKRSDISVFSKYDARYFKSRYQNRITEVYDYNQIPSCDFIISAGWHEKIPSNVIKRARIAALNCHSSLLPDYRGSDVYLHYWANMERFGGATVHLISEEFDKGDILCSEKFKIGYFYTPRKILMEVTEITPEVCKRAMELAARGIPGVPQNGGRYFFKISKSVLFRYRIINMIRKTLGMKVIYTPYKMQR